MTTQPDLRSRLSNVRYADKDYWNNRYISQPCEFDWFYGYTALRKLVRATVKRSKLVLHVGCGNSNFQEGMARDGYQVINTDISDVVIEQMRAKHRDLPGLRYVVSDCRKMPEFLDCQFGSVIDKGTVDALLCSKDAAADITSMFSEISRVLVPGGVFLLITLGGPAQRLALVNRPDFGWTVQVCLIRRVSDDQFAPSAPGRAIPLNDTRRPLSYLGPLPVQPDGTLHGLPEPFDPSDYFYAYACRKAPLVLPPDNSGPAGSKVRLPEGWQATVRAVAEVIGGEMGLPQGILERGRRVKMTTRASFERRQLERERERERQRELELQAQAQQQQQQQLRAPEGACVSAAAVAPSQALDGTRRRVSGSSDAEDSPQVDPHRQQQQQHDSAGSHSAVWDACVDGCPAGGSERCRRPSAGAGALDAAASHCTSAAPPSGAEPVAAAACQTDTLPNAAGVPSPAARGSSAPFPSGGHAGALDAGASQPCEAPLSAPLPTSPAAPALRPPCPCVHGSGPSSMGRTISYNRLSNSVKDAFAVLDAVDGEGHGSGEQGAVGP